tara:strand:- start:46650 stop:47207 length:558 start_codon:yes stop_codon:yes gene_type:complete
MEPMARKYDFDFVVTEQEAIARRLGGLLFKLGPQLVMFAVMLPVAGIIMAAAYLLCWFFLKFVGLGDWALIPALPLFFVAWKGVGTRICQRSLRLVLKPDRQAGKPITVEVGEGGVRWLSPGFEGKAEWSAIDGLYDTPEAVLFAMGAMAYYVPRRSFADEASRQALIADCVPFLTPEARAKSRL